MKWQIKLENQFYRPVHAKVSSYIKPHWPLAAPAPYHQMYRGVDLPKAMKCETQKQNPHPIYKAFMDLPQSQTYAKSDLPKGSSGKVQRLKLAQRMAKYIQSS